MGISLYKIDIQARQLFLLVWKLQQTKMIHTTFKNFSKFIIRAHVGSKYNLGQVNFRSVYVYLFLSIINDCPYYKKLHPFIFIEILQSPSIKKRQKWILRHKSIFLTVDSKSTGISFKKIQHVKIILIPFLVISKSKNIISHNYVVDGNRIVDIKFDANLSHHFWHQNLKTKSLLINTSQGCIPEFL